MKALSLANTVRKKHGKPRENPHPKFKTFIFDSPIRVNTVPKIPEKQDDVSNFVSAFISTNNTPNDRHALPTHFPTHFSTHLTPARHPAQNPVVCGPDVIEPGQLRAGLRPEWGI
jgi:hypothetical protein